MITRSHSEGEQPTRIPIRPDLRDRLREEKRGQENWSDLLERIYREWKGGKE